MVTMDAQTVCWLAAVVLLLFVAQSVSLYAVVKMLTQGRALLFERRELDREPGRVLRVDGR